MHDQKLRARWAVDQALNRGELHRPDTCERCGSAIGTMDAHHADYAKPLDVEWLCRRCHTREHYPNPKPNMPLTFRVTHTESAALKERAAAAHQSVSAYVRETLGLREQLWEQKRALDGNVQAILKRLDRLEELAGL